MTLAVLGGQDLDQLQAWVVQLFDSVPSGRGDKPSFTDAGLPFEVGNYRRLLGLRMLLFCNPCFMALACGCLKMLACS